VSPPRKFFLITRTSPAPLRPPFLSQDASLICSGDLGGRFFFPTVKRSPLHSFARPPASSSPFSSTFRPFSSLSTVILRPLHRPMSLFVLLGTLAYVARVSSPFFPPPVWLETSGVSYVTQGCIWFLNLLTSP